MEPIIVMIGIFIIGTSAFLYVNFSDRKQKPAR